MQVVVDVALEEAALPALLPPQKVVLEKNCVFYVIRNYALFRYFILLVQ